MSRFDQYLRGVLAQAGREAQRDCSTTVEAQHLLLAMASQSETKPGRLLESAGLDHRAIRSALDREFEHSLSAAGVSLAGVDLQPATSAANPAGRLGTSVRRALERGLEGVRKGPQPAHLLLGILEAEVGTVPRALELAGVDRTDLMTRVRQSLA